MLCGFLATNALPATTGTYMGLRVQRLTVNTPSAETLSTYTGFARRLRQGHSARDRAQQTAAETWDCHLTRWGDNRRVPMPMRRGIPFRGDALGAGYTRLAAIGG